MKMVYSNASTAAWTILAFASHGPRFWRIPEPELAPWEFHPFAHLQHPRIDVEFPHPELPNGTLTYWSTLNGRRNPEVRRFTVEINLSEEEFEKLATASGGKMTHGYDMRVIGRYISAFNDMALARLLELNEEQRAAMIEEGQKMVEQREEGPKFRLITV